MTPQKHMRWHDEVCLINEATADVCDIYKRETGAGNASPWLAVFMVEGAKATNDASKIVLDLMAAPDVDNDDATKRLIAIRHYMHRMRAAMRNVFENETVVD